VINPNHSPLEIHQAKPPLVSRNTPRKSDTLKTALPLDPVFHIQLKSIHQLKSLPTPLSSNSTININEHSANYTPIQPYTFSSHRLRFIPKVGMSPLTVSYKTY